MGIPNKSTFAICGVGERTLFHLLRDSFLKRFSLAIGDPINLVGRPLKAPGPYIPRPISVQGLLTNFLALSPSTLALQVEESRGRSVIIPLDSISEIQGKTIRPA